MSNLLRTALAASASLFLIAGPALAGGGEWIQDFEKAKAKAKAEGKDLFLDFTGSDWCVWCKRLDAEVLSQDDFLSVIEKDYVLVKLDFPQDESLVTPEIRAQNEELRERYGVEGFPTIILTDAEGVPYAQTGYQPGGASSYVKHVAELREAKARYDEAMAAAAKAEGAEKAKHMHEALSAIPEDLLARFHMSKIDELLALEPGKEIAERYARIKADFARGKVLAELEALVNEHAEAQKWDELMTALDEFAKKNEDDSLVVQSARFWQGVVHVENDRFDKGIEAMKAAQALAPDSEMGKRIAMILPRIEEMKKEKDKGKEGQGGK